MRYLLIYPVRFSFLPKLRSSVNKSLKCFSIHLFGLGFYAVSDAVWQAMLFGIDAARKEQECLDLDLPEPTADQVDSACLSYRHDFGLLSEKDQDRLRFEAKEWLLAWRKTLV